ncbi:MAG: site-2 protease family protein [Deltaproteobacteria bacterium]|nr:site-2 protease family protein [Deltaproteobacteria bacterium]
MKIPNGSDPLLGKNPARDGAVELPTDEAAPTLQPTAAHLPEVPSSAEPSQEGSLSPFLFDLPAGPIPPPKTSPRNWGKPALLLLLTLFSTTTLGALWHRADGIPADRALWASPSAIAEVWSDSSLLLAGLTYSLPLIFILLCHEMGHYLACRYYRLPATPPFFLPAPVGLGTFGAFIRIKAPIRRKKELFDVGIAGPLAGFVALVPCLFYGIANSKLKVFETVSEEVGEPILVLGTNLATQWTIQLFHGPVPEATGLDLHPIALASWVGLLATALNLLPLGQLDGGHLFYAVAGRWQRRLAWPLWCLLALAGFLWPVWWAWCVFLLIIGLRHPPVWDEGQPLDPIRRMLALATLVILLISFMPMPVGVTFVAP